MPETFYGYCFPEPDGWHTPAVTLVGPEEVYRYTQLHGKNGLFREIRVTDSGDSIRGPYDRRPIHMAGGMEEF